MKFGTIIVIVGALTLGACTVKKTPIPTGGSKADGTLELSYEFGEFERPQIDWATANASAVQRCATWGYTGAEPFGGQRTTCTSPSGYGCVRWLATVTYQCTGGN